MPFSIYPDFKSCVADIKKKNPGYTDEQASAVCAIIEKRSKEKNLQDVKTIKFTDERGI